MCVQLKISKHWLAIETEYILQLDQSMTTGQPIDRRVLNRKTSLHLQTNALMLFSKLVFKLLVLSKIQFVLK